MIGLPLNIKTINKKFNLEYTFFMAIRCGHAKNNRSFQNAKVQKYFNDYPRTTNINRIEERRIFKIVEDRMYTILLINLQY